MKSTLFKLLVFLFLFSCSDSKEDLTKQVRTSIEKELTKKNIELYGLETKIIDLVLVKKGEYEYQGVLTTHEIRKLDSKYYNSNDTTDNSFNCEYDVSVISDKGTFQYEIGGKRLLNEKQVK
jgi:hypothetical protein